MAGLTFCAHLQQPLTRLYIRDTGSVQLSFRLSLWEKLLNSSLAPFWRHKHTPEPSTPQLQQLKTSELDSQTWADFRPQPLHSSVVPPPLAPRCLQDPAFGARKSKP
jgi:hypothetical protein